MPDDIRRLLEERKLVGAYNSLPAYQERRSRRDRPGEAPETREKRRAQLLVELGEGDVDMRMPSRG